MACRSRIDGRAAYPTSLVTYLTNQMFDQERRLDKRVGNLSHLKDPNYYYANFDVFNTSTSLKFI
ncbi:hypothetical protein J2N67_006707 (plasmid) [Bacillus thuringiensis]|nr:hypothetical protein J2N67_006707 [Bacillus thuringiensis]